MSWDDSYLVVRAATVYFTAVATLLVWVWRRPDARAVSGAMLATFWNVPALLLLQVVATGAGWWHFDARGGLLLGMPVDIYLAWAWLWGGLLLLAGATTPLLIVIAIAFGIDLIAMPAASPVVRLGPQWMIGEAVALFAVLLPSQLLGRWTARGVNLRGRAVLQIVAFAGLVLFVAPAIAIEGSTGRWSNPFDRPLWQLSLLVHLLAVPAALGLTAVQEFVTRGGGTPIPFDPPNRLVTTGPYAYVRNPMQIAGVATLVLLGVIVSNVWVSVAGLLAHAYSAGLAGWDEDDDLRRRFGKDWEAYRAHVRGWIPRTMPWQPINPAPPRLFVAETCGICGQVGRWFRDRHPRHLLIVAAESHPSRALTRITYETRDGYTASGVEAIARALEHLHLGWAAVGFMLRLPVIVTIAQTIVDASGGGPRQLSSPVTASPTAMPVAADPQTPSSQSDQTACST
jgi:protein-S-isoprenylcysteine O-methyltransferase Ste14